MKGVDATRLHSKAVYVTTRLTDIKAIVDRYTAEKLETETISPMG